MYFLTIKEAEQERITELLASILEIDDASKEVMKNAIENKGVDYFLRHPYFFNLLPETCVKIGHIKHFIDMLHKEVKENGT